MKINFKITTKCPANCLCCQERLLNFKKFSNKEENLDLLFDKMLELYRAVGDKENFLSITGGEPTLVSNLSSYIKKMTENNISVGVDTNGWNINEQWLEEMEKAGLQYILFSVYSFDKTIYEYLRGSQNEYLFSQMQKTLSVLKEYKMKKGVIKIRLQTVLMKPNFKELPSMLEKVIVSGFDALSTSYYIAMNPNKNLLMSQKDIQYFIDEVEPRMLAVMKMYKIDDKLFEKNKKKIHSFFKFDSVTLQDIEQGKYRKNQKNCEENNRIAIYPNGVIAPCLGFDYYMDEDYVFNILEEKDSVKNIKSTFEEFWKKEYVMCSKCSSGYQVWLEMA